MSLQSVQRNLGNELSPFLFPSLFPYNLICRWPTSLFKTRHWSILELISQVSYYIISLIYPWRITDHDDLSFSYISKYSTMESSWRFQIESFLFPVCLKSLFICTNYGWLRLQSLLPGPHDDISALFISQNCTILSTLACPPS